MVLFLKISFLKIEPGHNHQLCLFISFGVAAKRKAAFLYSIYMVRDRYEENVLLIINYRGVDRVFIADFISS